MSNEAKVRVHRRNRERGPWFCGDCPRSPMGDITTFRRHVVRQHGKYCSWSGHVRPFVDEAEADRMRGVIRRAGRRSTSSAVNRITSSPATSRLTRGQQNEHREAPRLTAPRIGMPRLPTFDAVDLDGLLEGFGTPPVVDIGVGTTDVKHSDGWCQSDPTVVLSRSAATQTPSGGTLLLPLGWSVQRLTELAASEPRMSPRALALAVSRQRDQPLPLGQFAAVELVLEAQVEAFRYTVNRVGTFQHELRAAIQRQQPVDGLCREMEVWLTQLQSRARSCYGPLWSPSESSSGPGPSTSRNEWTSPPGRRTSVSSSACRRAAGEQTWSSAAQTSDRTVTSSSAGSRSGRHCSVPVYVAPEEDEEDGRASEDTEPEDWGDDEPYL